MMEIIDAYNRNPHVARKLIRFNDFIPANIIDKDKKTIPIKIKKILQKDFLRADKKKEVFEIRYEGHLYYTKIGKIHMDENNKDIDEIELYLVS